MDLLYHSPLSFQFLVPHPYEPHPIPYFRFSTLHLKWPFLPFLRAFLILLLLPLAPYPFPSFPFILRLCLLCCCWISHLVHEPPSLSPCHSFRGHQYALAAIQSYSHLFLVLHDALRPPPLFPIQLFFFFCMPINFILAHTLWERWGGGHDGGGGRPFRVGLVAHTWGIMHFVVFCGGVPQSIQAVGNQCLVVQYFCCLPFIAQNQPKDPLGTDSCAGI